MFLERFVSEAGLAGYSFQDHLDSVLRTIKEKGNLDALMQMKKDIQTVINIAAKLVGTKGIDGEYLKDGLIDDVLQTEGEAFNDLLSSIHDENGYHARLSNLINKLQEKGVLNEHDAFNPFDQNWEANDNRALAASQSIYGDNYAAHEQMVLIREGGKEYYYIIDRSEILNPEEHANGAKAIYNIFKIEAHSIINGKEHDNIIYSTTDFTDENGDMQTALSWQIRDNIQTKIDAKDETVLAGTSDQEIISAPGPWYKPFGSAFGYKTSYTFEEAKQAGYMQRQIKHFKDEMMKESAFVKFFSNGNGSGMDWFDMAKNDKFFSEVTEYANILGFEEISVLGNDLFSKLGTTARRNLMGMNFMGLTVMNSLTYCNVALKERFTYYAGYNPSDNLYKNIASLSISMDEYSSDSRMTAVTMEYAAFWGKLNGLSFGRKLTANGVPGHISAFGESYFDGKNWEFQFHNVGGNVGDGMDLSNSWGIRNDLWTDFESNTEFYIFTNY